MVVLFDDGDDLFGFELRSGGNFVDGGELLGRSVQ